MALTDPLGDLLTRIRNGQRAKKDSVLSPASKLRARVLEVLQREGYIRGFSEDATGTHPALRIELKYFEGERIMARLKMSTLPRNANPTRVRNRCELTGRPRAYYRKFRLCRIQLRDLANKGLIPGVTKSSW